MATTDLAFVVKEALAASWAAEPPIIPGSVPPTPYSWTAVITLHVDDDFRPSGNPTLLVANDGGPAVFTGDQPWAQQLPGYASSFRPRPTRRPILRMTAFAKGRKDARDCVEAAADWLAANRPAEIRRVEDISDPLITRDRGTGAFLASVLLPVLVRPSVPVGD